MKKFSVRFLIALCYFILVSSAVSSQAITAQPVVVPGTKSTWKGFARYDFKFNGRDCRLVCPDKPAAGNPWIWNARFPDWHTEMDSLLLLRGFYVTYINTDEFNGSPDGVAVWDEYFRYLTGTLGLENVAALEGISRGGLYIYNFAKKYPWRVSCIYAEAPVCDIKSWPGGFGKGKGSPDDWDLVMKSYKFRDDNEARSFSDNPVDNLENLARSGVPILHMIGLHDGIVPPEENTFILAEKYVRLGGAITIVPCSKGKQDLDGHHFDIETPALAADFITQNTRAFRSKMSSRIFHDLRGGLEHSASVFEKVKHGRVAFLGGSITYNNGWRDSVSAYIRKRFPDSQLEFINAGIPSLGSVPDAFRLYTDVLSKGPVDLIFVEAAVNDRTNNYPGLHQIRSMEGIVRQVKKANPLADIIFMYFAEPGKTDDYNQGIIPSEIANHELVAAHYNIPAVNLAREVALRINNKEFTWEGDFIDLHPSPFGQQVYAASIEGLLAECWGTPAALPAPLKQLPEKLDAASYESGRQVAIQKKNETDGWTYTGNWTPGDKAATREGFVNVPMLNGDTPGKILRFNFRGTAVGISVAAGPDAGILEYSIDNGVWSRVDLFTQWSNWLHLPWYLVLGDELKNRSHVLKIRLSSDKNEASKGTVCRIRYFLVN
jgi:sialidase-1